MKKIALLLIMAVCLTPANAQSNFGKIEALVKLTLDYPLMKTDFTKEQLDAWEYKVSGYQKEIDREYEAALSNAKGNEELPIKLAEKYNQLVDQEIQLLEEWAELYRKACEESGMLEFATPSTPEEGRAQISKVYHTLSRYVGSTGEIAKYHVKLRDFAYDKWIPFAKSIEPTYKYIAMDCISKASIAGIYTAYAGIMLQYISARDVYKSLNE